MKAKRIIALMGVILLVMMYVLTLLSAIFFNEETKTLFRISLYCTVAVPILLWILLWMIGRITGKRNITSPPEIPGADMTGEDMKTEEPEE